MQKKKGISLIVLVITIIVMIILAAAIILSLNNAGIIGNANKAVFKQNIKNYISELDLYYMDALIDNSYTKTKNIKATATTNPSITDLIPSMSEEDKTKFRVAGGNLIYIGANRSEYEWCRELGIIIDSTNLSQEEYNNLYKEEIAYAESVGSLFEIPVEGMESEFGYQLNSTDLLDTEVFVVPYGYEGIAMRAFYNQSNIKEIIIPGSVTRIGQSAFAGTGIEKIILPELVTYISSYAFQNCTALKSIDFLDSVITIGKNAFEGCASLIEVNISKTVTYIEDGPFSRCDNLKSINVEEGNTKYESEDGILYNETKTTLINVPAAKTGVLVIPNTVTTIESFAASGCNKITSVQIPDSVTKINSYVFSHCESLTNIVFPHTITSLGPGVLSYCHNLTSVKLPNNILSIPSTMFYECKKLKSIEIPENVTSINTGAFQLSGLETVRIPANVKRFETTAFASCTNMKTVYIESPSLTSVGDYAFTTLASGSTIYVRNAGVASMLSGKYTSSKTTISTDYNW